MKVVVLFVLFMFGFSVLSAVPKSSLHNLNESQCEVIPRVLLEVEELHAGMTRKDLLKSFTTEGGLFSRVSRTYVSRLCPYIKIDVRFKTSLSAGESKRESPDDKIVSISKPYIAYTAAD